MKHFLLFCILIQILSVANAKLPDLISPYEVKKKKKVIIKKKKVIINYFSKGERLLFNNDYKNALPKFLAAIEHNDHKTAAIFNLGCCFALSGKYKKAIAFFKKAQKNMIFEKKVYSIFNIASCYLMEFIYNPEKNSKLLKKSETEYKNAAFNLAYFAIAGNLKSNISNFIELYKKSQLEKYILKLFKKNVMPDSILSLIANKESNSDICSLELKKNSKPLIFYFDSPSSLYYIGISFFNKKLFKHSNKYLKAALKRIDEFKNNPYYRALKPEIYILNARTFFNNKKYKKALNLLDKSLKINPKNNEINILKIKILLKQREFKKAFNLAQTLLNSNKAQNSFIKKIASLKFNSPDIKNGYFSSNDSEIKLALIEKWIPFSKNMNSDFFTSILSNQKNTNLKCGLSRGIELSEPYIYSFIYDNDIYTQDEKENLELNQDDIYKDYILATEDEIKNNYKTNPNFQIVMHPKKTILGKNTLITYITMTDDKIMTFYYLYPTLNKIYGIVANAEKKTAYKIKSVFDNAAKNLIINIKK